MALTIGLPDVFGLRADTMLPGAGVAAVRGHRLALTRNVRSCIPSPTGRPVARTG
jgi:hypothetical protein